MKDPRVRDFRDLRRRCIDIAVQQRCCSPRRSHDQRAARLAGYSMAVSAQHGQSQDVSAFLRSRIANDSSAVVHSLTGTCPLWRLHGITFAARNVVLAASIAVETSLGRHDLRNAFISGVEHLRNTVHWHVAPLVTTVRLGMRLRRLLLACAPA